MVGTPESTSNPCRYDALDLSWGPVFNTDMTFVVCEPCISIKDHACVDVCPVNCFYEGTDIILIHPEECIDCSVCVPECPVEAIFAEEDVPEKWASYTAKNAEPFEGGAELPVSKQRSDWEADKETPGTEAYEYYKKYPSEA